MGKKSQSKFLESRLFIFLVAYFCIAILITSLTLNLGKGKYFLLGDYFIYGGIVVIVLGFLFMDRGSTLRDPPSISTYAISMKDFKKRRKQQKPFERVLFMSMSAGLAISFTGFLISRIFF